MNGRQNVPMMTAYCGLGIVAVITAFYVLDIRLRDFSERVAPIADADSQSSPRVVTGDYPSTSPSAESAALGNLKESNRRLQNLLKKKAAELREKSDQVKQLEGQRRELRMELDQTIVTLLGYDVGNTENVDPANAAVSTTPAVEAAPQLTEEMQQLRDRLAGMTELETELADLRDQLTEADIELAEMELRMQNQTLELISRSTIESAAADALARLGEGGIARLSDLLEDRDAAVRAWAAEALADIGPDAEDAVPTLKNALSDRDRFRPAWHRIRWLVP